MPVAVVFGTAIFVWVFTHGYRDSNHRWAAVGAILAGSAAVVGVIGLPFAIYQLAAVERDLSPRSELRDQVNELRVEGAKLVAQFPQRVVAPPPELMSKYRTWTDKVASFLREKTDEAEAQDFSRVRGESGWPTDDLNAQLDYLRDNLLPKVIARYW